MSESTKVGSVFFELGFDAGAFKKGIAAGAQRLRAGFGDAFASVQKQGGAAMKKMEAQAALGAARMAASYAGQQKALARAGEHGTKQSAVQAKEGAAQLKAAADVAAQGVLQMDGVVLRLKRQFSEAGQAIGAAFAPVLVALAPVIGRITGAVVQCMNALAALGAWVLGGRAAMHKAGGATQEYAASLGGAGRAAKKAKGQLAAFDELNNLNVDDGAGSGGGSGAGAMMAEADVGGMFKEVDLDPYALGAALAQKLNAALDSIDWAAMQAKVKRAAWGIAEFLNGFVDYTNWESAGQALGEGLNTALGFMHTFVTTFDWGNLGKGIAAGLSGAVARLDWGTLGRVLAAKLRIAIDVVYGFVTGFDWKGLGSSIGVGINSWFDEIDWVKGGAALSEGVKGVLDTLVAALAGIDWFGIGESIWGFLSSIDWSGIVLRLTQAFGMALGGLGALLAGFISDAVEGIKSYFAEKIEEAGGSVVLGLLKGILDGMAGIGAWIQENLLTPFVDGFKSAFGIHSPSTVMAEMGGFIMAGLIGGIVALVERVVDIFNGIRDFIVGVFVLIRDRVCGIWNNLKVSVLDIITNIKTGIAEKINGIRDTFITVFTSVKERVTGIFEGIWSGIKGCINGILGGIESMANGVISGVNSVIGALNRLRFGPVPDWVPGLGGKEFGFDIPQMSPVSIPKLATGGVVSQPTLAMIGEAGKEAVVPLENNTGWMVSLANILADVLVSKLLMAQAGGGDNRQQDRLALEIDGREMGEVLLDYILDAAGRRGIPLLLNT